MDDYEYFEKTDNKQIEKIIREQGKDVCRNMISNKYLSIQTKDYDFGYIRKSPIAQIGQRKTRKKTEESLSSFVLCKLQEKTKEIFITLLCFRPTKKDGKHLLDLVTERAKEMDYKYISLFSIGETRLLNWYKSQDFYTIIDISHQCEKTKSYFMRKDL